MSIAVLPCGGGRLARRAVQSAFACLEPESRLRGDRRRHAVWERLAAPDLTARFSALWMDRGGQVRSDRGFLAGYGGPGAGGRLLLRPELTEDIVRALAFWELLTLRLAGSSRGVWIWGAARDPAPLRDGESMALCRGLLAGARPCLPPVPPLEGAPPREQGYLAGALGLELPKPLLPPSAAAGTGLVCFAEAALREAGGRGLDGRAAAVIGSGATAEAAARMAVRLGARIVSGGPADVWFLCGPEVPLSLPEAKALAEARPAGVFEGCPLACAPEAADLLDRAGVLYAPALAAGSGALRLGPADSAWEAERRLRTEMRVLCRRLRERQPESLFRAAYSLALENAADELVRRGI